MQRTALPIFRELLGAENIMNNNAARLDPRRPPPAISFEKLKSPSKLMQKTALPILWELPGAEKIIKNSTF